MAKFDAFGSPLAALPDTKPPPGTFKISAKGPIAASQAAVGGINAPALPIHPPRACYVRFTTQSRHSSAALRCPLCARSGHRPTSVDHIVTHRDCLPQSLLGHFSGKHPRQIAPHAKLEFDAGQTPQSDTMLC